MRLETNRLWLRECREDDYPFYCELETNPHTIRYEADNPPSQEELNDRFNQMLASGELEQRIRYIFLVKGSQDGDPLGKVVIWKVDEPTDEWEIGWAIHPNYIGRGYASEAARALIEFGFCKLGANRIMANCNDANLASERVMQKVGMIKEGVFRETRKLRGRYYGSCVYSILRREYAGQANERNKK